MKDKILYTVIGILIGAIITTGVFMIINKNNPQQGANRQNLGQFMNGNGNAGEFNPEDMEGAQRTIMEDGTERYEFPDGRMMMRREDTSGGSGSTTITNP